MLRAFSAKIWRGLKPTPPQVLEFAPFEPQPAPDPTSHLSVFSLLGHELRTPLNAIVGFAELLQSSEHNHISAQQRNDYATTILENAQALQILLNQILDAGRAEASELSYEPQDFDFAESLEATARKTQAQADSEGVILKLDVIEGIVIHGDMHRMGQACAALIENAIRFSAKNSTVTIAIQRSSSFDLVLSITDQGRGISAEAAHRLFNPFAQESQGMARSHGGLGLGLYLANAIAKLHGGQVELKSLAGKGTEARLILPASCVTWPKQTAKRHAIA
jgi:signal transduction histidine kinase